VLVLQCIIGLVSSMLFAAFYQMYCNPYLPFLSLFRYLDKYGIH